MRRVVITGIGLKSPIGNNFDDFKENLFSLKSGLVFMPDWEGIGHLDTKVAGVVKDIDPKEIARTNRRSMDRNSILATLATKDALIDAKLPKDIISSYNTGLAYGTTLGGIETLEKVFGDFRQNHTHKNQTSMDFLKYMSNTVCANLSSYFNIIGMNIPICSTCTSSSQAIGISYEFIKNGSIDRMICGGSEAMHHSMAAVFDVISAASSSYNKDPIKASRPFDTKRDGVVISEGAATLVLEDLKSAQQRDANIYAELIGYASNCNGSHLTNPNEQSIINVMQNGLKSANISSDDVNYINAHATATHMGDIVESNAIYKVFKNGVPISSIKGQIGHTLAACGAIESIASIASILQNTIPANTNLDNIDEECADLNYVKDIQKKQIEIVLNNNFAFGGINTALVFKEYKDD